MRTLLPRKLVGPLALLLAACGVIAAPVPPAQADGLPKFTGYTLPGSKIDPKAKPAEGKPVALQEKDGLGATVLYAVFDRSEGKPGDVFGTGIAGLDDLFVAGKDASGHVVTRKFDTNARYLYVYQVINDSGRDSVVRAATVRLLVDPQLITSWGYFFKPNPAQPGEVPGQIPTGVGVGFATEMTDAKVNMGKPVMLPVSTEHPVAKDRKYENPSPYYLAKKPYYTSRIDIANAIKAIAVDKSGAAEDRGRAPEEVMLLNSAVFEGPPKLTADMMPGMPYGPAYPGAYGAGERFGAPYALGMASPYYAPYAPMASLYAPAASLYGSRMGYGAAPFYGPPGLGYGATPFYGAPGFGLYGPPPITLVGAATTTTTAPASAIRAVSDEQQNRSPAIRAFFLDNPLKPKERSTLFGFTSDYPPVYQDVRLRGNSSAAMGVIGAGFGDPDLKLAGLSADGEVPTPIAFESASSSPSVGVGFAGGGIGSIGGTTGGGGSLGGAGGGLPGFGGGLGGLSGGGGGTPSGGSGSNSAPTQAQSQSPTTTTPTTINQNNAPVISTQALSLQRPGSSFPDLGGLGAGLEALATETGNVARELAALVALGRPEQTPTVNVTVPVTQIANNTQSQAQQQQQKQQQQQQQLQRQGQHQHNGTTPSAVVPEPAAVIAALLGLPAFLIFARRKKTAKV